VRSTWRSSVVIGGLTSTLIVSASSDLSAHRLDEYLQAARIAIDPDRVRVELDLTAGMAIADAIIGVIDRDRTGTFSAGEEQAYAAVVQEAIGLELDGTPLHVELIDRRFPSVEAVRSGEGAIRLELAAAIGAVPAGPHLLLYRNAHRPDVGVYLANTLVPDSDRVTVTRQRRDVEQRQLMVDFVVDGAPQAGVRSWVLPSGVGVLVVLAALWRRHKKREAGTG
jgi:hypothetical protein